MVERRLVVDGEELFVETEITLNGQDLTVLKATIAETLGSWHDSFTPEQIRTDADVRQRILEYNELCDTLERQLGELDDWDVYRAARKYYRTEMLGGVQ